MKKLCCLIPILLIFSACTQRFDKGPATLVDPFIGTDGHGHTYPGATLPFGMVQLSPDTRKDSWDGCSGYHYSDKTIMGFSHTHLSGTGVGDYGDIRFMPMTGELKIIPGDENQPSTGYRSSFDHKTEIASPGYYQVNLKDYKIDVKLSASKRCGFHSYTFPESDKSYILIDLAESVTSDRILDSYIKKFSDNAIGGYRRTSGWANNQIVYFYAVFNKPFNDFGIFSDSVLQSGITEVKGNDLQAFVKYQTGKDEEILIKVGISATGIEGAKKNLEAEIKDWDFNGVKKAALKIWNKELSKIEISGGTPDEQKSFYTALYHSFLAPNIFDDVDGKYLGHDFKVHQAKDFDMYTVFSLWDTYRALHPLFTILQPKLTNDFINSFIDMDEKGGLLPVWELAANETNCMIGYHSVSVIEDAYRKGIRGFDAEKAFKAMKKTANKDQFGLKAYRENGYIPADAEGESVSKTLEYAYDDWCIAQMAKMLDRTGDYKDFIQRAQYYKNLYDPKTGFIRGKRNSMFVEPFDPTEVNFMLTEANTWQYTFYVPQDISGLMKLMGGNEAFSAKLDQLFTTSSNLTGREQSDITGLIGQYAHGNEPSHHMAYLYCFAGKPYKTQKIVRQIVQDLYSAQPSGLCGNEDCGQMSAWYVFSAMGFYPVTPGEDYYVIGSPVFDKVTIHLDNGNKFIIRANNNNPDNPYIQSCSLDGDPYPFSYIKHDLIMTGGRLTFEMGSQPNTDWGSQLSDRPVTTINDELITPVPFYQAVSKTFKDEIKVELKDLIDTADIFYLFGNGNPKRSSAKYKDTLVLNSTRQIAAVAYDDGLIPSKTANAAFYKIPNDWKISIKYPYTSPYTGGGEFALIDRQKGNLNFRTGYWQGYQGVDLEAVIDLGKKTDIQSIAVSFLEDQNSWIFMPVEVEFGISKKPYDFRTVAMFKNDLPTETFEPIIKEFRKNGIHSYAQYIKVSAKNIGVCPQWHKGAGQKAWLFVDEISINE